MQIGFGSFYQETRVPAKSVLNVGLFSLEPFAGIWRFINAQTLKGVNIVSEAKQRSVLRQIGTATIPASAATFDPNVLAPRIGLYAYENFVDRVRSRAQKVESMEALALPYSDLDEDSAYDSRIGSSLGQGYEFSETEVCYVIDRLVSRQLNGEDGDLLTNGYANLFYIKNGSVVDVRWYTGHRDWFIDDWDRETDRWLRGIRVFSRNRHN